MADQNEVKTKTIGFLPIEKVQTLKGWDEYVEKSTKLSVLRTEAQRAKNSVRDVWLLKTPSEKGLVRRDEIFPAVACQARAGCVVLN